MNICFKMCVEEGKGRWLLQQRCEDSSPCWTLVRLAIPHWKDKENVCTGSVHIKLSNNLENGKREHRASCSSPSRLVHTLYLPLVLGLRQRRKGQKMKSILWGLCLVPPYLSRKLQSGALSPASNPSETETGREVRERKWTAEWQEEPAAELGTARGAGWKTPCPQPTQPARWNCPNSNLKCQKNPPFSHTSSYTQTYKLARVKLFA